MRLGAATLGLALVIAGALAFGSRSALAHAPSGAIFTTLANGSEVNQNIFPSKEAVYLDGGPGPGAPQGAAGLDDGIYVFQVTNPNGATLLSTDPARCRQFVASSGIITAVVVTGCQHATGNDIDHPPAKTVLLIPYNLTPNPGGVFKVWVTRVEDFLLGCQQLGKPAATGLGLVDCGNAPGNRHGFIPSHSKTDNFKVRDPGDGVEIDVRFFRDRNNNGHIDWGSENEDLVPGLVAVWTDTNTVSNRRYSDPNYRYGTFAHVESAEPGTHSVTIVGGSYNGNLCTIGLIHVNDVDQPLGQNTVTFSVPQVKGKDKATIWIDVAVKGC